jgi:hypothetical protein
MSKQETINEVIELLKEWEMMYPAITLEHHYAKQEKPFDRWYVSDEHPEYIAFEGSRYRYGIGISGYWCNKYECTSNRIIIDNHRLATDKEILDKLSNHATSIGIKVGVKVEETGSCSSYTIGGHFNSGFEYAEAYNTLYFNCYPIMQEGKWVTVVEETKTIEERLTALENRL